MAEAVKFHFYLIAGTVGFTIANPENPDPESVQLSSLPVNAIVRHTEPVFPAAKLAKAQQNLHKSLLLKLPPEIHEMLMVQDIIISNVSHLGLMTEEEFQAPPEGMAQVQMPQSSLLEA